MVSWTVTEEKQETPEQADLSTGDKWDFNENSGTLTITYADGREPDVFEDMTYDKDSDTYTKKDGTVTVKKNKTYYEGLDKNELNELLKEIEGRLSKSYKNAAVTSFNKETGIGTATYTDENNVEHTIRFTSGNRTLLITRSEMKTIINVDEATLRTEIRKELDSLEEGWQLKVGNQVVTRRNKELWLSDTEKATEEDIIRIINDAVHSFVDFKNMSRAELIQHLEAAKADADKAGLSYSESTSFDHADLDIETNLKDEKVTTWVRPLLSTAPLTPSATALPPSWTAKRPAPNLHLTQPTTIFPKDGIPRHQIQLHRQQLLLRHR